MTVNQIIKKLGGARVVAHRLGLVPSTVYRWGYPVHRGGTNGFPKDYLIDVKALCDGAGLELSWPQVITARARGQ